MLVHAPENPGPAWEPLEHELGPMMGPNLGTYLVPDLACLPRAALHAGRPSESLSRVAVAVNIMAPQPCAGADVLRWRSSAAATCTFRGSLWPRGKKQRGGRAGCLVAQTLTSQMVMDAALLITDTTLRCAALRYRWVSL